VCRLVVMTLFCLYCRLESLFDFLKHGTSFNRCSLLSVFIITEHAKLLNILLSPIPAKICKNAGMGDTDYLSSRAERFDRIKTE